MLKYKNKKPIRVKRYAEISKPEIHVHNFLREGLNIWCGCGEIKKLKCRHVWKEMYSQQILANGISSQTINSCSNCGILAAINITTGAINIPYEN